MEKQREYEIRKKISNNIKSRIRRQTKQYYKHYQNNIGMLLYYPMIFLENVFLDAGPLRITGEPDRIATSWFLKEIINIGYKDNLDFSFDHYDLLLYRMVEYPSIKKMYNDMEIANQIMDMRSIDKININEISPGKFKLYKTQIQDKHHKEAVYFMGMDDEKISRQENIEINRASEYILKKYFPLDRDTFSLNKEKIKQIKKLHIEPDLDALKLSVLSAEVDMRKLGVDISSEIINGYQDLVQILGYFKYLSFIKLFRYNLKEFGACKIEEGDCICNYSKEWLVKHINISTGLNKKIIHKYLEYLTFNNGKGSICEFPLIIYNNRISFNPSSFILNDLHFSIVSGHYSKEIVIDNRKDTVSESVVNNIARSLRRFSNIVYFTDQPYSFIDSKGIKCDGEIDVGIYDMNSKCLLILECKWKDNVYSPNENYRAIEDTMNKIYNNQLSKHKKFIEARNDNIKYLFEQSNGSKRIDDCERIAYFAIDKRCQFHKENQHLLSVYLFLYLIEQCSDCDILKLNELINEIESLKTTTVVKPFKTIMFKTEVH